MGSRPPLRCRDQPLLYRLILRRRTAHAKIKVRLQFPEDYPKTSLIVELTSASLPPPFLRKLTKKAEEAALNITSSSGSVEGHALQRDSEGDVTRGNSGRAVAALTVVMDAVENNKFLPCWKELRQAATLVSGR